jgi:hypothetical protein
MKSTLTLTRPTTPLEREIVRLTIEADNKSQLIPNYQVLVDQLIVVSHCDCGCDSVDFVGSSERSVSRQIANAIGTTRLGGKVGIIIWGNPERITGLEVYDLGAGDGDIKLPLPDSVQSFSTGAA